MEHILTLKIINKDPFSGYSSDYTAILFSNKEEFNGVLCTFGVSNTDNLEKQSEYIAKCINYVSNNPALSLEVEDDIDVSKVLDISLVNKYRETGITFKIHTSNPNNLRIK